ELSHNLSMIMVTHNMQQGKRVADYTAFFHLGELIEFGESKEFIKLCIDPIFAKISYIHTLHQFQAFASYLKVKP
ncbi:hypothetical protein VWN47_10860, partial [Campylobacter jejuni]